MKRAAIILLGLGFGCDSRSLVVITSLGPNPDTNGPIADANGTVADANGSPPHINGHFHMENLDRGLVAVTVPNGTFLSWRMFGYEYDGQQPGRIAYAVYRDGALLATVYDSTNFLDAFSSPDGGTDPLGSTDVQYSVAAIIDSSDPAFSISPIFFSR